MHLLTAQPGAVQDGETAVDLDQSPADLVVLSAAATDLAVLVAAKARLGGDAPSLRLANVMQLGHNLSVDLYVEKTIAQAKLVVIRLLGGLGYWRYGVEQVSAVCRKRGILLAVVPGDDTPDSELAAQSTIGAEAQHRLWQYCDQAGPDNADNFLRYAAALLGAPAEWREPVPLLKAGLYAPGRHVPAIEDVSRDWRDSAPIIPIVFYRALVQAGDTAPVDALLAALTKRGANPLPIYVNSLKDAVSGAFVAQLMSEHPPSTILNCTGFALLRPGAPADGTPFDGTDCPVLQIILSGGTIEAWTDGSSGLAARDLAMNVALPEMDGRIITRAISFKSSHVFDGATQVAVVRNEPEPSRVAFVADLALALTRLRRTPAAKRRIAVILANYPNRDGRLANGVGLDTPASVVSAIARLKSAGYSISGEMPSSPDALMDVLRAGSTNRLGQDKDGVRLSLAAYNAMFAALPAAVRSAVNDQWGAPESDPFVDGGDFVLPCHRFGNLVLAVQPSRGYDRDPVATYHDAALVPPHRYLAFYLWLRDIVDIHAAVHFGKHGNLEWLPGKAVALSEACFPEVALGPLPHIYPFIVNDPGEGTQAKRRAQAVIVDHLTPPLTRAETYGPLRDLEGLVDEYYQAAGLDPRRLAYLGREILALSAQLGLDKDVGVSGSEAEDAALAKIDNYLCEIKELQIRDGLHVFGRSPAGQSETDLLVALTRLPRGEGKGSDASLIRALADDLGLGNFDPLDCAMGDPWDGPRPQAAEIAGGVWRTKGDTVERLEFLAAALVAGDCTPETAWTKTRAVIGFIQSGLRPTLRTCGAQEMDGLLHGLDGGFVTPASSGAPTRGRLDVLPTGRNFYSVDNRAVPTPAAQALGWRSATRLLEDHYQQHGSFPRQIAMSAWGTANMRTGGDDIAQAMALMGTKPQWDRNTGRVTGFEIVPASALGRPRVDVVFRVSGFFRDAFPFQIDLIDSAARAVAGLDEDEADNPLAANVRREANALQQAGAEADVARRRAGHRVFGSKPGAYGAGLQTLIDERCWETDEDLARAYIAWGSYAYGGGAQGQAEQGLFERRLGAVDAVVHNQDNREHDLLDSDDYYQFEGGLAATVRSLSGKQPAIYHNDHSRPESPRVRTLEDEIGRIVRARAANPKWIKSVMRHGYKGAFEMAATVDYLFAFAATARVVQDHHFDQLYGAYLADDDVCEFIREANPDALAEMAARFEEAIERGLWHPQSNAAPAHLAALKKGERHVEPIG